MASPFEFFRKNQASMMVVLIILAMLAFTLGDLFTQRGTNFWLLGMLLGGAVFAIAGIGSGRWLQWGIGGAVLGTLLGIVLPDFNKPAPILDTKIGLVEQEQLHDWTERRIVANNFMQLAHSEAFGPPGPENFSRRPWQFQFGHSSVEEDVVFGSLLNEEASNLGITVSDGMVSAFINEHTEDKLSQEGFAKARRSLKYQKVSVRSETLFDILRQQIRAELAYLALVPVGSVSPPSPATHWKYFQRMNVRQALNVAELHVDDFVDQVTDPTDTEVNDLFESAAGKVPNQDDPGSPGFFLPPRARIAWLEVGYDSMEAGVTPVTDDEIEAHYNENRDPKYRIVVVPDKAEDEETSTGEVTPDDPAPAEIIPDSEEQSAPGNDSEDTSEPSDDSETIEESPANEPDAVDSDTPAEEEAPTEEDSAAEDDSPAEDESKTENSESGGQFSIDDPGAAADSETRQETDATEAPVTEGETDTPDAEETETSSPSPLIIPAATDEESDAETPDMELEYEYRELDDELKEIIRDELRQIRVREAVDVKMTSSWEFLVSLKEELDSKRAEIIKQGFQKYQDDPVAAAAELRRAMAESTPEMLERMETYAQENDLTYTASELLSAQEFSKRDDYPLGSAIHPGQSGFQSQGAVESVAYRMFSGFSRDDVAANDTQLFMPERAVYEPMTDEGTESHFAYWTVEFVEPHLPTLDEPKVRDHVVLAFKRAKAREILTERADQLAQKVRDGLEKPDEERVTMAATLENESVTGQEGSESLNVQATQPFSWLRQRQTPQMSFQFRPQAEQSVIRFADGVSTLNGVGHEFMKTIFEDMNDNDVSVVPNPDRTRYFLVQVTNRFPTKDMGMDGLHNSFAQAGQFNFMRSPVMDLMSGDILRPAVNEWKRSVWTKYNVDPDILPHLFR